MGVGTTTFDFTLSKIPQKLEYTSSDGIFKYTTPSRNAEGPIFAVDIRNEGKEYRSLPGISTILTTNGQNAVLQAEGETVGRIDRIDIQDVGFDYSVDRTLRPESKVPQLLKVDLLRSLDTIGITSVGKNYLDSPGLILLDGLTKKVVSDVELDYNLGDTQVSILNNVKTLNNVTPIIIPTSNSNELVLIILIIIVEIKM